MSTSKKLIRERFRSAVFARDDYRCRVCGYVGPCDAHHITDRTLMPNGGYVLENGISLCETCHKRAEQFHALGVSYQGYSPDDLYRLIGSSYTEAHTAAHHVRKIR